MRTPARMNPRIMRRFTSVPATPDPALPSPTLRRYHAANHHRPALPHPPLIPATTASPAANPGRAQSPHLTAGIATAIMIRLVSSSWAAQVAAVLRAAALTNHCSARLWRRERTAQATQAPAIGPAAQAWTTSSRRQAAASEILKASTALSTRCSRRVLRRSTAKQGSPTSWDSGKTVLEARAWVCPQCQVPALHISVYRVMRLTLQVSN